MASKIDKRFRVIKQIASYLCIVYKIRPAEIAIALISDIIAAWYKYCKYNVLVHRYLCSFISNYNDTYLIHCFVTCSLNAQIDHRVLQSSSHVILQGKIITSLQKVNNHNETWLKILVLHHDQEYQDKYLQFERSITKNRFIYRPSQLKFKVRYII